MGKYTKVEEFLAHINQMLRKKLPSLKKNKSEELKIKVSIYNIFEKHRDTEELYDELLGYLKNENLEPFVDDVENFYKTINK